MSAPHRSVADDVLTIARSVVEATKHPSTRDGAQAVVERLSGPLRVAIAGRVKAGKSTLLNALVGERLAPTDAGECTRVVCRYSRGASYSVTAQMRDGRHEQLAFSRSSGALDIKLGAIREADVLTIDVGWPTNSLERITLIDTPGLASLNDENSRRTREFLEFDESGPSDADAVIYLMRHAHRSDVGFLDAFMDRSVTAASPVNAVAVLSRADEIGAGRLDAMESATRIAQRYAVDNQVRGLCAAVVPVAGLLAETGLTLREDEVAALRILAGTEDELLQRMLLSTENFCETSSSDLTVELRRQLLERLGVFGLRLAVQELRADRAATAASLGPTLVRVSGLEALRTLIEQHFMARARILQARSAVVALRALSRELEQENPQLAARVDRELEQLESTTVQFAQVRGAHLVGSGATSLSASDHDVLRRLFGTTDPCIALGLPSGTPAAAVQQAALEGIGYWRRTAADPMADPTTREVCETATRVLEYLYGMVVN